MEIATYAANLAPPVFSPSVEGAKRDNYARETIPQTLNSQNSSGTSQAGSQGTTGTSSTLYAQSQQIVIQENGQRRQNNSGNKDSKENGHNNQSESDTAQTAKTQAVTNAGRISAGQSSAAESSSQSVAASYSGSAINEKTIKKSGTQRNSFAKYSKTAIRDNNSFVASHAVSSRYNSIVRNYSPGENLSILI